MIFLLFVCVVAAAVDANLPIIRTTQIFPSCRIVGGNSTNIENRPYQVSLEFFGRHQCGGSIIHPTLVVTAAHCVGTHRQHYRVRAGTAVRGVEGSLHDVKNIIHHENYTFNMFGIPVNDIALLELEQPFTFDKTRRPIQLFRTGEEAVDGVESVVSGWGLTGDNRVPRILRVVALPILSKKACDESYALFGGLPEGQICALYGGKGACYGDSGGPLTIDGKLAGIVSWGLICGSEIFPGVYMEVAHYYEWIKKVVDQVHTRSGKSI